MRNEVSNISVILIIINVEKKNVYLRPQRQSALKSHFLNIKGESVRGAKSLKQSVYLISFFQHYIRN